MSVSATIRRERPEDCLRHHDSNYFGDSWRFPIGRILSNDARRSADRVSMLALNSPTIQRGIKDILLNHARLWETFRDKPAA